MKKTWTLGLALIWLLFSVGSCVIAVVEYDPDEGIPPAEEFSDSMRFPLGGTVIVNNVSGDIEIQGWEKNQLEIYAEKWMPDPWEPKVRVFSTDLGLPEIDVDSDEDSVRIKTRVPRGRNAGDVHYLVTVPEAVQLEDILTMNGHVYIHDLYGSASLETDSGNIDVVNFSGTLDARTNQGHITVSLYDLRPEDRINLQTEEGDITLDISPEAIAAFEIEAPGGRIESQFGPNDTPSADGKLSFEMGTGEAKGQVVLTARSGNITIKAHDLRPEKEMR